MTNILHHSIPGGLISFVLIGWCLPMSESSAKVSLWKGLRDKFRPSTLARIDVLGMFLLLASSILLVFGLEEGGTRYPWSSPAIISTLVIAISAGIGFVLWEIYIDSPRTVQEPVFPPSLTKDRLLSAMLL